MDKKYKLQDRLSFRGLDIAVENRAGSIRRGDNWETRMFYPYGYIRGTMGVDGDPVDVYVGKERESDKVFIIHQKNPDTGKYDEDKVMLGFETLIAARDAYLAHYDSHKFLGEITVLSFENFKKKVLATKEKPKMIKSIGRILKAFGQQMGIFDAPTAGPSLEGETRMKDGKTYQVKRSKKNPNVKRVFRIDKPEPEQKMKQPEGGLSLFDKPVSIGKPPEAKKDKQPVSSPAPEPKAKPEAKPEAEKKEEKIPDLFSQPQDEPKEPATKKPDKSGLDQFGVGHLDKQIRKQRIEINRKVRELLASKKDEEMTDDDIKLLAQYSGTGGTDIVSLNEYYTPDYVAKFQWDMLKKLGFKNGSVLEPSCGTGVFIHTAPEEALVTGIEYDETSSRIAGILFKDHDIHGMSFEKYNANEFDREFQAAIGNVPFGVRGVSAGEDPEKINVPTHEQYFLDRIVDNLEEGGVASIIVPTGIMDNQINQFRLELNKKAEFLGAIRMPTGVFAKANAVVTTDIVFFRKRPQEVIDRLGELEGNELKKLYDAQILDADFVAGEFFSKNPEYALGEDATGQFGQKIKKGNITEADLNKAGELIKDFEEDYSVLGDLGIAIKDKRELHVGDIMTKNGRTYRLNENHRWERLSEEQARQTVLPKELQDLFGIKTYAELDELQRDRSRHFELTREQLKELDSDYNELDKYLDKNLNKNEYLKQAVILGLAIREFQKGLQEGSIWGSDAQLEAQRLAIWLDDFKEKYGNPVLDKAILKNLGKSEKNPLLYLAGSFDGEGNLSRIFDDPLSFYNVYKTKAGVGKMDIEDAGSITNYYFENSIPATLEIIKQTYRGELSENELHKAILNDETIYIDENGNYAPINEVCMGEVYSKLDYWEERVKENKEKLKTDISDFEKEILVLENKKLDEQIFELRRRAGTKNIEDLPVSIGDAGRFFSMKLLNEYLEERIPNHYSGEVVIDPDTKLFTFRDRGLAEIYNLFASKGSNDKEDTKELKELMKARFGSEQNPFIMLVMNKLNNIPSQLRGDKRERIDEDLQSIATGIKTFLSGSNEAEAIADAYNRAYNNYIQKTYDNSPIEGIEKYDYDKIVSVTPDGRQITARDKAGDHTWATVRRMYDQGKGMIAHGVGLGKTLQGILLTLLAKQTGRAKKPLIVTPKSILINWAAEIEKWTKNVNFMMVGYHKKDESKGWTTDNIREDTTEQKKLKLMQVASGDYDMVLMTRDFFTSIDFSIQTKENMIDELTDKFYPGDEDKNKKLKKKKEGMRQNLTKIFMKGIEKDKHGKYIGKADDIYFENLGFDMIMRDEAHDTKNLLVPMEMEVAGLNASDARRSYQHYFASKIIRNNTDEKGVYSLTATPISNSPLEVFNMMLPFAEKELEKMNVNTMDDFIRRFAEISVVPTTDADGRVKMKNKFTAWQAPDELRNAFFRFVDYKTKDDVESVKANIKFPNEKPNNVFSEMNEGQRELMKHCRQRLWTIKYSKPGKDGSARELDREKLKEAVNESLISQEEHDEVVNYYENEYLVKFNNINAVRNPDDPPFDDTYFSVQSDMIKITGDLEWYSETSSEYSTKVDPAFVTQHAELPKFDQIIDNVSTFHTQGKKQLLFAINTRLHNKIKDKLIASGVPAEEIVIVNGKTMKNSAKRKEVSDDYNAGKYKVVIGNYATMGEGLNFNNMTSEIHHIQPAWNYLQIEQGNGRGIRQGNPLDEVNTHYYNSKGSIDAFMNQKIKEKGKMVDQFMRGEQSTWDDETQLQAEQMLIELSDNPELAEKLYAQQNKKLQEAIAHKERSSNFRRFDQLYDMKNRLSKMEDKASKRYLALQEEIEKTMNQLNNSDNFEHKQYLTLDKKPIVLPGSNVVIPVGSVIKYGFNDQEFAIVDNYSPSTGNVTITEWSAGGTKRKKMAIKYFASQYGETIEKRDFDTEEMFNKLINDEENKMDDYKVIYKLPKDQLQKHKKQLIKNLREGSYGYLFYRDSENNLKAGRAYDIIDEIDEQGGRLVFPQEDDETINYLHKIIANVDNRGGYTPEYWASREIAKELYGEKYDKVLERLVKQKKGETVVEEEPEFEEAA